jgi:hypothetical protein
VSEWTERAPGVYPNTTESAKWLVRVHRDDLLREGAIARVGRELIVFGARYTRWLEKQSSRVADYQIAPNRTEAPAA